MEESNIDISGKINFLVSASNDYGTLNLPEPKYKLTMCPGFSQEFVTDPPNWFHRKMMNLLLGWEFEIYE